MTTTHSTVKIDQNIDERFFSLMVTPINSIENAKETSHYDSISSYFFSEIVQLQQAEGIKRIYFIPVNERVEEGKEVEYLAKFGKKPVTHAPNYLLGAMAQCKHAELPKELKYTNIVAVSTAKFDFFHFDGKSFFLCCHHLNGGRRELSMARLYSGWGSSIPTNIYWMFTAEDIEEK
jgi:hypothetical protein